MSHTANIDLAATNPTGTATEPGKAGEMPVATNPNTDGQAMTSRFDPLRSEAAETAPGLAERAAGTAVAVRHAFEQLPCNIGPTEQKLRLGAGTALVAAAIFAPVGKRWKLGMAAFGALQLATGATRYCPVWHATGVNTNKH